MSFKLKFLLDLTFFCCLKHVCRVKSYIVSSSCRTRVNIKIIKDKDLLKEKVGTNKGKLVNAFKKTHSTMENWITRMKFYDVYFTLQADFTDKLIGKKRRCEIIFPGTPSSCFDTK